MFARLRYTAFSVSAHGMTKPCPVTVATIIAAVVVLILICTAAVRDSKPGDSFWTQYGGAIPPDEQARRFDAAEKGVPDMAWAEAYWPPNYCQAVPL